VRQQTSSGWLRSPTRVLDFCNYQAVNFLPWYLDDELVMYGVSSVSIERNLY
jgi:hypothetical protein